jgi:hypothetical protein
MGVGWLGAGINAGSGTLTGARDYKDIATLYCSDNGTWTYIPNSLPTAAAAPLTVENGNALMKSLYNTPANEDPTAPNVQAGGTRRRGLFRKKSVSKKSAKTSKRHVKTKKH